MLQPEVVYEDENLVAVNKPAGLLVHPIRNLKISAGGGSAVRLNSPPSFGGENQRSKSPGEATLADWLVERYPHMSTVGDDPVFRPGIVHRLDRDTSGIMIAAKTQSSFEYLKSLFAGRNIKKTYLAWVWGVPRERQGVIRKPIGIVSGSTKRSTRSLKMSKEAVTRYVLEREKKKEEGSFSLLRLTPETGRTHQIRVHCASMGHPVVGDALYGRKQGSGSRLMLHALSIELPLQESQSVLRLEAEPPRDFKEF